MDELVTLLNNIARFLAYGLGAASVIVFIYAGFVFMTAAGDPQKMSQARMVVFGAFVGLIVAGSAFMLPRIISQAIIEPSGGVAVASQGQVSCDELLKEQLVSQRGANNAARMQEVVGLIQDRAECSPEIWALKIDPTAAFSHGVSNGGRGIQAAVGRVRVPSGLRLANIANAQVRGGSYRDTRGNILVRFGTDPGEAPADGAAAWLYVVRLGNWYSGFE